MQRKERKTNKKLHFWMYCFTLLLHLIEKLGYNQVTYEHVNLLLEDLRNLYYDLGMILQL